MIKQKLSSNCFPFSLKVSPLPLKAVKRRILNYCYTTFDMCTLIVNTHAVLFNIVVCFVYAVKVVAYNITIMQHIEIL